MLYGGAYSCDKGAEHMAHETPSVEHQLPIDRLTWRTIYADPAIGALALSPTTKVLDKWGRDPNESSHMSSRIPLSIRDDGSVRYIGQAE